MKEESIKEIEKNVLIVAEKYGTQKYVKTGVNIFSPKTLTFPECTD